MNGGITVNNMNAEARNRSFVVFRVVNGEAWYFDAWDDINKALRQALEINGQFIPTEYIREGGAK